MIFNNLILILIVLAAFSLLWWGVNSLSLPQPMKVCVLVIMGLIGLAILWNLIGGGGGLHITR